MFACSQFQHYPSLHPYSSIGPIPTTSSTNPSIHQCAYVGWLDQPIRIRKSLARSAVPKNVALVQFTQIVG